MISQLNERDAVIAELRAQNDDGLRAAGATLESMKTAVEEVCFSLLCPCIVNSILCGGHPCAALAALLLLDVLHCRHGVRRTKTLRR